MREIYSRAKYPNVDHIHFYGFYIGNYPELDKEKIRELCSILNDLILMAKYHFDSFLLSSSQALCF